MATAAPTVSFTATNLNTFDRLPGSLESIRALGAAVGGSYEVVVADGPSDDGATEWLAREASRDPKLHVVSIPERNRGRGRREAFEASTGRTVIPFDTSLAYDAAYGPILSRFLALQSPKMLFSEICALSRNSVEAVGGWRDLIGGEDVDLYARVIARFGVLAYPTGHAASQSAKLGSYARQMRYVRGGRLARFRRIYAVQRDQIIGSHASVSDLLAFNRSRPASRRVALAGFFALTALGAKLSPIGPAELGRNNYVIVREGLFQSLLSEEWRSVAPQGPPPRLPLTADETDFLSQRSSVFRNRRDALAPYLTQK
ncbi:MAG: glycosyltransferase [Thermoplasmata archaeon]|nr:glycosyltransferase [Thermoplasmata archaeon]